MNHDFEDIEVKENAAELLENALRRKRSPCMIGTGAMCDPYMHCETKLGLTRRLVEIIDRYGFGLSIQTKSASCLRDIELFSSINKKAKCVVEMTLTTYDEDLCRILEPRVSTTRERFEALCTLKEAGIPTVVWISPILPFINDTKENLEGILDYCIEAGAKGILCFGMGTTLRDGDREYFYDALDRHFPGMKERYMKTFGNAYECRSDRNDVLMKYFHDRCEKNGIIHDVGEVFTYLKEFPAAPEQLRLI